TFCHVSPPSVERYTPSPQPDEFRSLPSPVPTQTTSESDGATATAPTESIGCLSKIGWKVTPLSLVLKKPPCPSPTQNTNGLRGSIAMSDTRLTITAGPIERAFRFLKSASVS